MVWTGTVQTTEPENVDRAISNYVETVISALKARNLLEQRSDGALRGTPSYENR
jgi:hypothetical protein